MNTLNFFFSLDVRIIRQAFIYQPPGGRKVAVFFATTVPAHLRGEIEDEVVGYSVAVHCPVHFSVPHPGAPKPGFLPGIGGGAGPVFLC